MGNGPYPSPQPPQKHHWTLTPAFWVGVIIMICGIIGVTPIIREWMPKSDNSFSPAGPGATGVTIEYVPVETFNPSDEVIPDGPLFNPNGEVQSGVTNKNYDTNSSDEVLPGKQI